MDTSRIRTSHAKGETPPNTFDDFAWAREHEAQLLDQYGERIILVYEKQVLGSGETIAEAEQDAARHLPPDVGEVTPVIVLLSHRHPFFRVRPTRKAEE
jgi:hypothetical protein